MTWILKLIVTLVSFPVGKVADVVSSKNFPAYGIHEKNKSFDDADGKLNIVRAIAITCAFEAGLLVVFFFVHETVAAVASVLVAVLSAARAVMNWRKKSKRRDEQNKVLQGRFWYGTDFVTDSRTHRSYYPLFPWIYSEKVDIAEAVVEVNTRLEAFRLNPRFPG